VRPIYVPLHDERIRRALVNVAEREFRDPRAQAAKFIVEGLERVGALTRSETAAGVEPVSAVTG
jgi:hypothetical protein